MRITEKERLILASLQACADQPLRLAAGTSGSTEASIRRVLARGVEHGQIRRRVYVNLFALGLQQYGVFFALPPRSVRHKSKMRDVLLRAPFVELLLELNGRYHFGLVLTVRSAFDVERFFDFVTSQSKIEISDLSLQARTGWFYFGIKYLDQRVSLEPIHVLPGPRTVTLKHNEGAAIYAFASSEDGNRSHIARKLGIPAGTLQYQIESLQRSGILLGVRYQIAPELSGYHPFRVLLNSSYPASAYRERIYCWSRQCPYVVSLMHGMGPWQYELRLEAPHQAAVSTAVDDLLEKCSDFISHAEIVPVVKVLKMQLCPDKELLIAGKS